MLLFYFPHIWYCRVVIYIVGIITKTTEQRQGQYKWVFTSTSFLIFDVIINR